MQQNAEIMTPFGIEIDLETGAMPKATNHIKRNASDMRGYYQDADALERLIAAADPLHYEVFEHPVPEVPGHLMYCISKLYPGTVGRECFMTKGHYHTISETAEIYLCLRGEGQMVMKTAAGRFDAKPMRRGMMVYVPPLWAHRSVNTGNEPLVSFCVYPADAGHNYGDIEVEGFPSRVFLIDGEVVIR
ncbi:MAG: cupin domain-containing protein [Planctomycetes bacterium]|jgi:glucose-6-phosphate isomerase|nr:cupin domain-containing protein [Planctomycetota bacterium]